MSSVFKQWKEVVELALIPMISVWNFNRYINLCSVERLSAKTTKWMLNWIGFCWDKFCAKIAKGMPSWIWFLWNEFYVETTKGMSWAGFESNDFFVKILKRMLNLDWSKCLCVKTTKAMLNWVGFSWDTFCAKIAKRMISQRIWFFLKRMLNWVW